jgi:hypothetical protein
MRYTTGRYASSRALPLKSVSLIAYPGVFKASEITAFKGKAFSDSQHGFAYFSSGQLRNNSNKAATTSDFGEAYGPGDIIGVQFNSK